MSSNPTHAFLIDYLKTLNVVARKFCWIFFKKREISIVNLTNYININGSNNHENNHNHLDYYRNSLAILFNLVLGLIEL